MGVVRGARDHVAGAYFPSQASQPREKTDMIVPLKTTHLKFFHRLDWDMVAFCDTHYHSSVGLQHFYARDMTLA